MKVTVKLTKTSLFEKQYLQPDAYGIVKNGLMQRGVNIAEKMFLLDSQTLFKQKNSSHHSAKTYKSFKKGGTDTK